MLAQRGLHAVPLQTGWARGLLGLKEGDALAEMKVISGGRVYGGADALLQIARAIWWAWPLFILGKAPGMKALLRKTYVRFAANRPCDDGKCEVLERKAREHRHVLSRLYEMS
jgi:predicted DCC family thiol-disulfide oxidoreductase YuxK